MRFRAAWAGLLMVLLLSLSTAATACEVACGLAGLGASCHGEAMLHPSQHAPSKAGSKAGSMAGMSMTPMRQETAKPPQSAGAVADAAMAAVRVGDGLGCIHAGCGQSPALLKNEAAQRAQADVSPQAVVLMGLLLPPPAARGRVPAREAPHLPVRSPVSLRTTLRI